MFEEFPYEYKDGSIMIGEAKYQNACRYFQARDFETAELVFNEISHHNDSSKKLAVTRSGIMSYTQNKVIAH